MTNKEIYRQLCEVEKSIPIYSQPFWMDAVCGEDNWDVLLYEKRGNLLGTLPYYVKERMGLRYITQPPFTQHNGVWIRYPNQQSEAKRISLEKEVITELIEQLEKLPVCHYQQHFAPTLTNWLPFYWKGYQQTTLYTYRLPDISHPEKVFAELTGKKRTSIRKAEREKVEIKFDLPADVFYQYHKECLAQKTQDIQYSFALFQRIYTAAYSNHVGKCLYAVDENEKILGAIFNIWDENWAYDLITAFPPDTRNSGVPDLLVFAMINFLSGKVQGYDFEGSMIPGIEDSYRNFGTTQTPYFSIHKTYTKNPLVRAVIAKKLR